MVRSSKKEIYELFNLIYHFRKKENDPVALKDDLILKLSKKYNKTPGQICLRWLTQRNIVVIPKSVTPSRIKENINVIKLIKSMKIKFFFLF